MKLKTHVLPFLFLIASITENNNRKIDLSILCDEKTNENQKTWITKDWGLKPWTGKICVTKVSRIDNLEVTEVQIGHIESIDSYVLIIAIDPNRSSELLEFSRNNAKRQMVILKNGKYVTQGGLYGLLPNSQITIYGADKESAEKMGSVILDGNINAAWNKVTTN